MLCLTLCVPQIDFCVLPRVTIKEKESDCMCLSACDFRLCTGVSLTVQQEQKVNR